MCSKGIIEPSENLKYVKAPNEGIAGFASRVFSTMGGIAKPTHFMHVVHMGGLDQTIEPRKKQFDLLVLMVYLSNVD
jgi:hypothetical protein